MKQYGVVGWKNTGKTGLITRLVTEFCARGLTVSTIKHAHHSFDVDQPGTDSMRHRRAGAQEVILASERRVALMQELPDTSGTPSLSDLMARLSPVDLVLIEGYKAAPHPKIETHRAAANQPLIAPNDPSIRAVASDVALSASVPVFDLDDTAAIADFIAADILA